MEALQILCVFAPIVGGALVHAPFLRFDWLASLKRPLDGRLAFRGKRLLGDNKTWRGAVCVIVGTVSGALLLSLWPWYREHLPTAVARQPAALFGLLLGVGTVVAEFPNSFLKRQLGVPPGSRHRLSVSGVLFTLYDQGDIVLGVWLLLLPVWVMPPLDALLAFVVVTLGHMVSNLIGYAIGARKTWI